MTTINIQEEIQKALLDDAFVTTFAAKLKKALRDDSETVESGELEVSFDIAEEDPNSFFVEVENFGQPDGTITFKDKNNQPVEVSDDLIHDAINKLAEKNVEGYLRIAAGLIYRQKEETING